MTHTSRSPRFRSALAALVAVLLLSMGSGASADRGRGGGDDDDDNGDDKALELRVNDAIGRPGGQVAIVLRTYAARPIRQGQISVRVRRGRPAKALEGLTVEALTEPVRPLTFLRAVVYSTRSDSATHATPTGAPDSQAVKVQFSSPSGTVNASDGPLAVLFFQLHSSVKPGQVYTIEVDPSVTSLVDRGGKPIAFEPINAELTVRAASAPLALEAEGDKVEPGETAELGIQTFEPFRVSSGRITLRYDPAFAAGPPAVRIDPRYGRATFTVERVRPGILVIDFQSPDKSLNTVPGTIVAVDLPTRTSAGIGSASALNLDPAGTWLKSVKGRKLKLKLESGRLDFED